MDGLYHNFVMSRGFCGCTNLWVGRIDAGIWLAGARMLINIPLFLSNQIPMCLEIKEKQANLGVVWSASYGDLLTEVWFWVAPRPCVFQRLGQKTRSCQVVRTKSTLSKLDVHGYFLEPCLPQPNKKARHWARDLRGQWVEVLVHRPDHLSSIL